VLAGEACGADPLEDKHPRLFQPLHETFLLVYLLNEGACSLENLRKIYLQLPAHEVVS
jgi:hypothetical protein